jgi:hypothetical protein
MRADTAKVTFTVDLNLRAIHDARTLAQWSNLFALEHDRDVATWTQVYHAVALGYLAGGDYSDFIIRDYFVI